MEHFEEVNDLFHRVGRPRLLPVTKGRIGDKDLLGRIHKDELIVELHTADLVVGKDAPVEIGLLGVEEGQGLDRLALKSPFLSSGNGHRVSFSKKIMGG